MRPCLFEMKKGWKTMKKHISLLLVAVMMTALLAGCGSGAPAAVETAADQNDSAEQQNTLSEEEVSTELPLIQEAEPQSSQISLTDANDFSGRNDIAYVLIYNPANWDEEKSDGKGNDLNEKLNTGTLESQIDANMRVRAGLEDEEPEFSFIAQTKFTGLPEGMELNPDSVRAGGLPDLYDVGDTSDFFVGISDRRLETLTCLYAGDSCYVWALNGCISDAQAQRYGKEFDEVIYPADTEIYGSARFVEDGGKVHILYYDFASSESSVLGFFKPNDLFSSDDFDGTPADKKAFFERNMLNVDRATINVNAIACRNPANETVVFSTQAHEFQHLICFTDYFESFYGSEGRFAGTPDTWLNEAMSGYIEEKLYPGVKESEGHYFSLASSGLIRHGQSLYNFYTSNVLNIYSDVGVYGSVFLFSNYLENENDSQIFHRIHDYYRAASNADISTAAALYASVDDSFRSQIDQRYSYPAQLQFASKAQEWTSKMALDYYLSLLSFDSSDPACYANVRAATLLYDELDPTLIEGGGRVLVATLDGSFTIPDDADYGLIYIGLDKSFNPVTGICYK